MVTARLNITYPMLFRLTNAEQGRHTHCGVLEFSAEEGRVYVPKWVIVDRTIVTLSLSFSLSSDVNALNG